MDWMKLMRAAKAPAIFCVCFSVFMAVALYAAKNWGELGVLAVLILSSFLAFTALNYFEVDSK